MNTRHFTFQSRPGAIGYFTPDGHMFTVQVDAMTDDTEQLATIQHLTEQLAAYQDAVRDAVQVLGHEGCEPVDLRDALGEIERLLAGQSSCERSDLQGLAEDVRAVLWHRDRAVSLLESARAQAHRHALERDQARAAVCVDTSASSLIAEFCYLACANRDFTHAAWLLSLAVDRNDDKRVGVYALQSTQPYRHEIHGWHEQREKMCVRLKRDGRSPRVVLGEDVLAAD